MHAPNTSTAFALVVMLISGEMLSACMRAPLPDAMLSSSGPDLKMAPEGIDAAADIDDGVEAVAFLRTIAQRYRESGKPIGAELAPIAPSDPEPPPVVSTTESSSVVAISETEIDEEMLRRHFPGDDGFDALVNRCLDSADDEIATPKDADDKIFGWFCRASIIPEATAGVGEAAPSRSPNLAMLSSGIDRLMRLTSSCQETPSETCRVIEATIDRLVAQQPVSPLPSYRDKIAVEQTAMPPPSETSARPTIAAAAN